ncbi:hypothetical protein [Deinococcus soli (ex Cha et al. 2016)]|uniref:hypothetical protein n=1 Tax=Deinococcus soli (ex Cha et al. 2016) TaxID=1309411 RepID=UPI0016682A28|nr:hypothetical protein [Deinococcus soli (ex Cha et al. 2016)]GGB76545.1 hypothetical protein GCM10008019_35950 [Deinococcus soli (ex Cha et al. 2016)]
MADDWTFSPAADDTPGDLVFTAHTAESQFTFKGHRQNATYALTLAQRTSQVLACTAAKQRLDLTRHQHLIRSLLIARTDWTFLGQRREYAVTLHPWTARGVFARVVRLLRARGWATLTTLQADLHRWGGEEATAFLPHLAHSTLAFVEWQPGSWTLTPWLRLGVPFSPTPTTLPGQTFYERAAAEFWITRRHVPTPHEEWHPGVRQVVQEVLSIGAVPICFEEHPYGEFQQVTLQGTRRLRLIVDRLPEGLHFTRLTDDGDETYSVTGRAFVMDGAAGVRVMTDWAGRRWQEALLHPDDEPGFIWHPVGLHLRKVCRAARITPRVGPGPGVEPLPTIRRR